MHARRQAQRLGDAGGAAAADLLGADHVDGRGDADSGLRTLGHRGDLDVHQLFEAQVEEVGAGRAHVGSARVGSRRAPANAGSGTGQGEGEQAELGLHEVSTGFGSAQPMPPPGFLEPESIYALRVRDASHAGEQMPGRIRVLPCSCRQASGLRRSARLRHHLEDRRAVVLELAVADAADRGQLGQRSAGA